MSGARRQDVVESPTPHTFQGRVVPEVLGRSPSFATGGPGGAFRLPQRGTSVAAPRPPTILKLMKLNFPLKQNECL